VRPSPSLLADGCPTKQHRRNVTRTHSLEGLIADGQRGGRVRTTELLGLRGDVLSPGVDDVIGTELAGQRQLVVGDIDSNRLRP
jgi:hypothetical protein